MKDGNGNAGAPRSLASALEEVAAWRSEQEGKAKAELAEVDSEIDSVRSAIANLTQQLEALRRFRDEVAQRTDVVGPEETARSYKAIFSALLSQQAALEARSAAVRARIDERDRALLSSLQDPAAASLVREYEQFRSAVAPTLAALPESYRAVLQAHHEGVTAKLRALVEAAGTSAVTVDEAPITLDVAVAMDDAEGAPPVLMMVVPATEAVNGRPGARPEDPQTWVAARALQGLYEACAAAGVAGAHAAYGGHQGLLAVEIEAVGMDASFATQVTAAITRVAAAAKELQGAGVVIQPMIVPVDHLLPPESGEEATDAG